MIFLNLLLLLLTEASRSPNHRRNRHRHREPAPSSRLTREIQAAGVPVQEIMVEGDSDSDGSLGSKLGERCVFCYDNINDPQEGTFTGCGERHGPVHPHCREQWILTKLQNRQHPSCPMCRRAIRIRFHAQDNSVEVRHDPSRFMLSVTQILRTLFGGAHGLFMGAAVGIAGPMGIEFVGVIVFTIVVIIVVIVAVLVGAAARGGGDCSGCDCNGCDCNGCDCNGCGSCETDPCACDGAPASNECCFLYPYDPCYFAGPLDPGCNCDCNCNYGRTLSFGNSREWFEMASQRLFIPGVLLGIVIGVKSGLFMIGFDIMSLEMDAVENMFESTTYRPGSLALTSPMPPTPTFLMPTTQMHPTTTYAFPKLVNLPGFLSK